MTKESVNKMIRFPKIPCRAAQSKTSTAVMTSNSLMCAAAQSDVRFSPFHLGLTEVFQLLLFDHSRCDR